MKPTRRRPAARLLQLGSIALALLALQGPAHAVDYVWKGANGNWDDANQWTLLGVPGAGDSALLSAGSTALSGTREVGALRINGGRLYGGDLTVGSLTFESGLLGGFTSSYTTGSTTVTGAALFDGTRSQAVNLNHTLTLQGASRWTAGSGGIGGSVFGGVIVNDATFSDEGAGGTNAYKTLRSGSASGGGSFVNNGTYVRTGLGLTRAYGFQNAGTLQVNSGVMELRDTGTSTGQINVASGAQLSFYESSAVVSGGIANLGLVTFDRGNTTLTSTARLDGNVNILGGVVHNGSVNTLNVLSIQGGGQLSGIGHITVATLDFQSGTLGGSAAISSYPTGATTVTGTTTFDGTRNQSVNWNHTLTLQGDSRWTAGSGGIGGSVFGGVIVNNATFNDEGAGSANAYKTLRSGSASGGGTFVNNGTYVRTGAGLTRAYGLQNAGTLQVDSGTMELRDTGTSTGQINVASGARLSFYESSAVVSGGIANGGLVTFDRGNTVLTSTARLDGNVNLLGGVVHNASTNTLNTLSLQGGQLSGTGHITVTTLDFQSGTLGGSAAISSYPTGATTVTGTTTFDGTRNQSVNWNHTLTLQGDSRWTAGSGAIGGSVFGGVIVNNATFNDEGANAANAYKTLRNGSASGGGSFVNTGTYVRSGAGTTRANGFDNRGLLAIDSGTFDARDSFVNTGTIQLASAGVLQTSFTNAGLITGTGKVNTGGGSVALVNNGTLNPGLDAALGTLTIEGSLRLNDSSVLHVDLGSLGLSDQLVITNQALWNGELSVWLGQGATLQLGDTYTIASTGQRLSNSVFDNISWHGLGSNQLTVEYTANSVLLHVTAVPEPATYALWAAGMLLLGARKLRTRNTQA